MLRGRMLALVLLLLTVGCDRATKHIASTQLQHEPPKLFMGGAIRLEYAENTGAFLSLGATLPPALRTGLLTFGVGAGLAGVALVAWRRRWTGPLLAGAALVWAGGASNLVDRALHGRVVDFVVLRAGPFQTGVFNVADVAILFGAVFLALVPHNPPDPQQRSENVRG